MSRKLSLNNLQTFVAISLIALFALFAPHILRYLDGQPPLIGSESYYHARISEDIIKEGIPVEDTLVYGSRPYVFNPYHLILAPLSLVAGAVAASIMLPFAGGLLSVFLFYLILSKLGFSQLNRITILCVFALSPVFINTFASSNPSCIALPLLLAGFYFFIGKGRASFILSLGLLGAASFFGIVHLFVAAAATLPYSLVQDKKARKFYAVAFLMLIVLLSYYLKAYFAGGLGISLGLDNLSLARQFVADFGGMAGFSIFSLLLAGLGIAIVWVHKSKYYPAYITMTAIVILSFFLNSLTVYSNLIIAVLAGITLSTLIRMKWELKVIRNLSIVLLFCGLLFSAVSYSVRISSQQPNSEVLGALEWIGKNSDEGSVVFTHYSKGFWVEFEAGRQVVADSLGYSSPYFEQRIKESKNIFDSWDIQRTRELLSKYNVTFIFLTNDMSEGLVWDKPEQGLAYLIRNSETFKKEYSNAYAGVWRYVYGDDT